MCKMPYGESDFKKIRGNGFVYIDKTSYIERLENDKSFIHFLRPRRFGKTLFTSMLSYYYDINEKDHFEELFHDTYIYDHPTKNKNNYYILKFNFSGFSHMQGIKLEDEFKEKVLKSIQTCIRQYGFQITLTTNMSAARLLSGFFADVRMQLQGKKIYIMIDEYDHFANDLLSFSFDEFQNATKSDGFVRAFFEEIKAGTETVVDRIFVTGVSPITLDSMTSGYNISSNLSLDARYNDMCGFTSEDMKHLISLTDNMSDIEQTLREMKQYYDGYMFSREGEHHVFNPNMALYYLDAWQSNGKAPNNILDKNIMSDYQKLENLLNLSYENSQAETIQGLLDGEHPYVSLTEMFQMNAELSTDDFLSLLYYLGYLTMDERDEFSLTLKIPNMAMQKVFTSYFQQMLRKTLNIKPDGRAYTKAIIDFLKQDNIKPFIECIETVLHQYPDRLYQNFHERNIQQIADMIVFSVDGVDCDLESRNDEGYSDFLMIPSNSIYPNKLIEMKYLKKEYTESQLQHAIQEAKKQIQRYQDTRQMVRQKCDSHIMIFAKDTCIYFE